jgi:curved DNA-binding protein CbpA
MSTEHPPSGTLDDSDDTASLVSRWDELLDDSSYYEILGLLEIAGEDAIREAFHGFARAFHPDAHSADPDTERRLLRIFQRGVEAYRVLVEPALRAHYDLALAKGQLRLQPAGTERPGGPVPDRDVKSLDELCVTAGGRRCAARADTLIGQGRLAEAKRELLMALQHEGGRNPDLAERIDALDLALFAAGS